MFKIVKGARIDMELILLSPITRDYFQAMGDKDSTIRFMHTLGYVGNNDPPRCLLRIKWDSSDLNPV